MRYDEHPTWRMLEKAKIRLKKVYNELSMFNRNKQIISDAHNAIVEIQKAVENRICRDMSGQ